MKVSNPITAAKQAARQAAIKQRQQTAANRILARSDRQQARYAKNHPLYNYQSPTSVVDPTATNATDNSLNQPNQLVQGTGGSGDTTGLATNATGGVTLGTGSGSNTVSDSQSQPSFFERYKWEIIGAVGLAGFAAFMYFRR